MKKIITLSTAIAVVLMSVGCGKDVVVGPSQYSKPTLPSEASMTIPNPSFLNNSSNLAKKAQTNSAIAVGVAYWAVVYWTSTVRAALVVPTALFVLAHSAQPTQLPDKSGWQWVIGNSAYNATLVGRVAEDSVRWSMTVSGGNLSNFKWYEGTSTITGSSGYWTFYDTASVNGAYSADLRFSYNITGINNGQVKVEVINPIDTSFGSYLQWTSNGTAKSFTANDAKKQEVVLIQWDEVTEAGFIQNVTKNEKYCWDTKQNNHADITCIN